jgi:PAS domain S-box-containing protein
VCSNIGTIKRRLSRIHLAEFGVKRVAGVGLPASAISFVGGSAIRSTGIEHVRTHFGTAVDLGDCARARTVYQQLPGTKRLFSPTVLDRRLNAVVFLAALLEERRRAEQTRAQAAAIVESSNDAIIGETLDGIITSWNRGAEKLFGYSATEVIGCPNTILMPSNDGTIATHNAERINESEAILSYETVRLAKGGRPTYVSVTLSSVIDAKGRKIGASSIIRDITQRKRAESRLNAQYAVTRVLSESDSVADAAPRILQAICECLDWELGEIWRVDCETNLMTLFKSWHLPSKDLGEFASESLRFTFSPGVGLPGRVWKSREAGWIRNLAEDKSFVRASLVATAGLRCAFGFPVVLRNETLGAMVFFSHDSREPDQDLLEMMASVGGQMGQFIERKQAEEALRESQKRLARTENFSLVMVTHTDLEGRWLKVPPTLCKLLGSG